MRVARRLSAAVALGAAFFAGAASARAHDETVSTSDVTIDARTVLWKVDVGTQGLEKAVKLLRSGPDLTEADLQALKPDIARYLLAGLEVDLDGARAVAKVGSLEPIYEPFVASGAPYIARVALELRFEASKPVEEMHARVKFFSDLTSQHRALLRLRWDGQLKQLTKLGPTDLTFARGRLNPSRWAVMGDFLLWGTHHIFIGYDHIAFLLALLIGASRMGELIKIVTAFTVAHTITILLAAFGILRIPEKLTESLIAASIVYVAADNLIRRGKGGQHRWLITFAFGLVHGLGFAGVLRERLEELPGKIVWPVISFNLGVELGQLVIVALAYPLLLVLRRAGDEAGAAVRRQRIVTIGSVPILLLGLMWLGTRIVG